MRVGCGSLLLLCDETIAVCALSFTKVSLMNVAALAFRAWIFRIESSSWRILPLMSMKCPSLSFLMTLVWKSILFNISFANPACFFGPFAWKIIFPAFHSEVVSVFFLEVCFL